MARLRRSFNTGFKREAANLVLKEGYSDAETPLLLPRPLLTITQYLVAAKQAENSSNAWS